MPSKVKEGPLEEAFVDFEWPDDLEDPRLDHVQDILDVYRVVDDDT